MATLLYSYPYLPSTLSLDFLSPGSLLPGGWDAVRRHNHELCIAGRDLVLEALGQEAPAPDSMLGSIASIPLPPGDPSLKLSAFDVDPDQTRLFEDQHIEIPIFPWPAAPQRLIRLSAQLYNDIEDMRALAGALGTAP